MSHVTLVRHGQANNTARDEAGYDKLSPLGWQQAEWLGDHFRSMNEVFGRVYTGTLRRHVETAQGIKPECLANAVQDERLNEMEYFTMAKLLEEQHKVPLPEDREGFVHHIPQLMTYWQDGKLEGTPETFSYFEKRVSDVVQEIAQGNGRALVVTSGGLIAMVLRVTMRLDTIGFAQACLAIQNTSIHRWQPFPSGLGMVQFNATPHLETIDRQFAQTHL